MKFKLRVSISNSNSPKSQNEGFDYLFDQKGPPAPMSICWSQKGNMKSIINEINEIKEIKEIDEIDEIKEIDEIDEINENYKAPSWAVQFWAVQFWWQPATGMK